MSQPCAPALAHFPFRNHTKSHLAYRHSFQSASSRSASDRDTSSNQLVGRPCQVGSNFSLHFRCAKLDVGGLGTHGSKDTEDVGPFQIRQFDSGRSGSKAANDPATYQPIKLGLDTDRRCRKVRRPDGFPILISR